jgi:hypothetical protein
MGFGGFSERAISAGRVLWLIDEFAVSVKPRTAKE